MYVFCYTYELYFIYKLPPRTNANIAYTKLNAYIVLHDIHENNKYIIFVKVYY
jgi:hypothetical protein